MIPTTVIGGNTAAENEMNSTLRMCGRQSSTARSGFWSALPFAAIGGVLGAVTVLLWLEFGWWALAFAACVIAGAATPSLITRLKAWIYVTRVTAWTRTPWETGVGSQD